ncbi:MAG TPA: hypothetical protein VJT75_14760 [Thermoleophilaceae bacterium]|nr:hypothetical protein [Thermoleophilaceae bacterium]
MRRRAAAILSVTASAIVLGPPSASAFYRVDHASVPGIGRIGTVLPTETEVHPPGRIPDAKPVTERQLNRQMQREGRINQRVHPGPDVGPADDVARVKRQVARDIFLRKVALTCKPIPKAALWVYYYVHAPPGRRPYINSVETNRQVFEDEPHSCVRARLRVDRWQGVRIDPDDPDRARAMLRGAVEVKRNGKWHGDQDQRIWKLALRLESDRWRIAVNHEQFAHEIPD